MELVAPISPVERSSHGGMVVVKLESTCGDCTVNMSVERPGQCRLTTARSRSPCDNGGAYVGVGMRLGRPTSSGRAEGNSKTHTKHSKPPQLGDPDRPQGWGGWICRKQMLIASPYAGTPPTPQIRPPLVQTNHLNVCENAQIA